MSGRLTQGRLLCLIRADLYAYEAGRLPLFPGLRVPPESEIKEVLNYIDALQYGLERLQSLPVRLGLIHYQFDFVPSVAITKILR